MRMKLNWCCHASHEH